MNNINGLILLLLIAFYASSAGADDNAQSVAPIAVMTAAERDRLLTILRQGTWQEVEQLLGNPQLTVADNLQMALLNRLETETIAFKTLATAYARDDNENQDEEGGRGEFYIDLIIEIFKIDSLATLEPLINALQVVGSRAIADKLVSYSEPALRMLRAKYENTTDITFQNRLMFTTQRILAQEQITTLSTANELQDFLLQELQHEDPFIRMKVIDTLTLWHDPAVISHLQQLQQTDGYFIEGGSEGSDLQAGERRYLVREAAAIAIAAINEAVKKNIPKAINNTFAK